MLSFWIKAVATLGLGMALSLIFSLTEITVLALSPEKTTCFSPDFRVTRPLLKESVTWLIILPVKEYLILSIELTSPASPVLVLIANT